MNAPISSSLLTLLLPLALSLPAAAQTPWEGGAAQATGPDPAEMAAFEETLGRFSARMGEFRDEARAIVDRREQEERAQLDRGYSAIIGELETDDLALRATAMKKFEAFLDKYPNTRHSPHVMFRLAELYFEQTEEDWFVADDEYRRMMDTLTDEELDFAPEEPKKDYAGSVALYRRILRDYPDYEYLDGCWYMLGYILSEPIAEQYNEEEGLAQFQALVDNRPESEFAAVAHLRIGEYHFDYNDFDLAVVHYERVVQLEGREGALYDEGLYKLAWSYYKKSEYDRGLMLLTELLDWSEQVHFARKGKESPTAPEAIEYSAISFSDVADQSEMTPVQVAQDFYTRVGERSFEPKVYKRLADVLVQQARYEEAVETYNYIQQRWPNDAENPDFQWQVARLYMSMVPPRVAEAQQAIADLNTRYGEEGSWHRANRANPDALAKANKYVEDSLAAVAQQYHTAAIQSGAPEDYEKAASLYRQYLTKFPFAKDYYEIQWYLADTFMKSGQNRSAEAEYLQLLKSGEEHDYKDGSLWQVMQIRRQRVVDTHGDFKSVPADTVVERMAATPGGKQREVFGLGKDHGELIEACDQLVDARFESGNETSAAYAEALESFRPALAYLPGQILYHHGRLDEARPRLERVIETWPLTREAEFSAKLIVDSYTDEEDWAGVRKYAGKFKEMKARGQLGPPQVAGPDATIVFGDQEEGATFKMCRAYIDANERKEAAECFLTFTRDYPESKYIKEAFYNAANSYEIIGRVDEANRLFEEIVNRFPDDEDSRRLFFRIAGNYASALDLDNAIRYYEELYNRTKGRGQDYQDAPAALYNASFLRIGLGDNEGAARNFERYALENPEEPDAEEVFFSAGEQWENVGQTEALRFYTRYLQRYGDAKPDHVMQAYARIAEITEDTGRARDIDRAWDELADAYARLAPSGQVGQLGSNYAARAAFRDLRAELESFKAVKFTSNDEKNADLLLNVKLNQLTALEQQGLQLISTYQDFEYASASLYVMGDAYLSYSDMLFDAPPPKGLDDEEMMLYTEAIDQKRLPIEDKGKARLVKVLEKAENEKAWSEWQTKTLAELNRRYPLEYAQEKQEQRGAGDSNLVPMGGPLSVDVPEEAGQ